MTRTLPLALVAIAAFVVGVMIGRNPNHAQRQLVTRYVRAWARQDVRSMYAMLDTASQNQASETKFAAMLSHDAGVATMSSLRPLRVGNLRDGIIPVRMRVKTRLFGTLTEILDVPLTGTDSSPTVQLAPELLFPGLRGQEKLKRRTKMPARGTLVASNGTVLAEGPERTSPIPTVAGAIVGTLGPIPATEKATFAALGYPTKTQVGQDGLERIFQTELAGRPGGKLLAGKRVLATDKAVPGKTVKTTIDPTMETAAIAAMNNTLSGIVVMNPRTGGLEAAAGIAFSSVQPPGSTMKIVTASAVLTAGLATLSTEFPYSSSADIGGYTLQNANLESCGGTLLNAFAVSCNSVFAPLGVKLGAAKLVGMAERFGFNQPQPIPGALESTIPSVATIGGATAVGSSAIGQGMVQASALQMTDVAATIAMHGKRPIPTLTYGARPRFAPVISTRVAGEMQQMMIAVVQSPGGTGYPAQIPGVEIAGKTGTAELRTTQGASVANDPNASANSNTDSWFVGYPVASRKVVVGALFPGQGAGATTAAPAVREVIEAALAEH